MDSKIRRHSTVRALFLVAALLSFGLSVGLYFGGNQTEGIFVGIWVPSILALGAFLAPRPAPEAIPSAGGGDVTAGAGGEQR